MAPLSVFRNYAVMMPLPVSRFLLTAVLSPSTLSARADVLLSSWLTNNSGQYARVFETTNPAPVTTGRPRGFRVLPRPHRRRARSDKVPSACLSTA